MMILLYTDPAPNKDGMICIDLKCNPSYNSFHAIPLLNNKWTKDNIVKSLITALIIPEKQNEIISSITKVSDGYRVLLSVEPYMCSDDLLQEPYREHHLEHEKERIRLQNLPMNTPRREL